MDDPIISYAQNREDVILNAFFDDGHKGFYVDIGASDPEKYSVTKLFYDKGWHGINIEPNEKLAKKLAQARTRDTTLALAVSDKRGSASFRQYAADGLSTLSDITKKKLSKREIGADFDDKVIETETLAAILSKHANSAIDFMKIDVEGFEYEVLTSNDWNSYRPRVICVEADKIEKNWPQYLVKQNYKKVHNDGLNDYYVDAANEPAFDYERRVIGRTIYPVSVLAIIYRADAAQEMYERANSEVNRLRRLLATKDEEINYLHQHVAELNRFKNMVKNLAVKTHTIIDLRLTEQFKKKKLYPKMAIDVSNSSLDELMEAIQQSDHDVFYRGPTVGEHAKMNAAKAVHRTYKLSAKMAKKVAKAAKHAIKRVKG